jgi:beta-glucosidase
MRTITAKLEAQAKKLRDQLTLEEKVGMLSGSKDFYRFILGSPTYEQDPGGALAAGIARLGIEGLVYSDGPRGITRGQCTCFPVPMARAATFDPALEQRVGEAMGREARAQGVNLVLAPCINVLRHPAWGRAQETYGEDPGLLADMGAALTRGIQKHALACVKHFACNSIEESRTKVDVRVGEQALHHVYLPAFRRMVGEGVAAVMSAYNSVNGQWCSQNRRLLTDILKQDWGFQGFVVSDWLFGVHDGPAAVRAGLDLEMPSPIFLGKRLLRAVKRGQVPMERVDDACLRLIRQQLRVTAPGQGKYGPEVIACDKHRALAREVATKAIVLLRNERVAQPGAAPGAPASAAVGAAADTRARAGAAAAAAARTSAAMPAPRPVLPLNVKELRRLAVIGRLADQPNLGDRGSSGVNPPSTVTPLQGLRAALPEGVEVSHDDGSSPKRAASLAATADAAVVVVGYDHEDEGEYLGGWFPWWLLRRLPPPPFWALKRIAGRILTGSMFPPGFGKGGDRASLTLHSKDEDLLLAVAAANPRTVAAVVCGSAVLMERWREVVPAILILWYPGMEGGHALADIVLGNKRPTGRLPFAIPTNAAHLPDFDNNAETVSYGPLHGQALLDHLHVQAAFPFGHGLTYK